MAQYYLCIVLIVSLFFLFIHEIIRDFNTLVNSYKRILLCSLLAFLFKYNFGLYFYGLEYEDAYVFSFCARQFSYNIFPSSFLIDAVSIGSLTEPILTSTYGGHFIMYSTYLSLFTNIFGWSPATISIANTIIAFFILLILSLLPKNNKYWFLPPILYCCAPIINIFTTCFLSEIFSSFVCLVFVYTYFQRRSTYNQILCLTSFFVAIMCKRENLALLSISTIESMYWILRKIRCHRKEKISEIKRYIPFVILTCVYFLFIQNVFNIEAIESNDIENSTFSIRYMAILLPAFIKSMLNIETFSIVFAITVLWIIVIFVRKEKIRLNIIYPLILFSLYLILYSLHYRGYFFVKERSVSSFETYRYINNFFYLLPILFVCLKYKHHKLIKIFVCIALAFSLYNTYSIRYELSGIERKERFDDAQNVSKYIQANSSNSILICENILLYQNICGDDFNVCDIRLYKNLNINEQMDYYLLLSDTGYLEERYSLNIDLSNFYPVLSLKNGKYLYKYDNKNDNDGCSSKSEQLFLK